MHIRIYSQPHPKVGGIKSTEKVTKFLFPIKSVWPLYETEPEIKKPTLLELCTYPQLKKIYRGFQLLPKSTVQLWSLDQLGIPDRFPLLDGKIR